MSKSFRLSLREKIEIVKWYAIYKNAAEVARPFQNRFDRIPPTSKNILSLVRKFDETGSVEDKHRSVSTDENREHVRAAFEESPATSIRRAGIEVVSSSVAACFERRRS
jgi:hypothetical protein